jgi:hypothetical protein
MGCVWPSRRQADESILITEAPVSLDDQQAARRKKYGIMMTSRVACLLLAAATFHYSIWLALALIGGGMILPWCAVIIANDRPPRKAERVAHFKGDVVGPRSIAKPPGAADGPPADEPREDPAAEGGSRTVDG